MNSYNLNDKNIEKINTFKVLVENYDDEMALKYLEKSGWDETVKYFFFKSNLIIKKAAQLYYDDQSESLARNIHSNENMQQNNIIDNQRNNRNNNINNDNLYHYEEVGMQDHLISHEGKFLFFLIFTSI